MPDNGSNKIHRFQDDGETIEFDDQLALIDGVPVSGIVYRTYSDGSLESEMTYQHGLPDGLCEQWYPNGQLERRWIAKRGKGASEVWEWYESGAQKSYIQAVDGEWKTISTWNEEGKLTRHEER